MRSQTLIHQVYGTNLTCRGQEDTAFRPHSQTPACRIMTFPVPTVLYLWQHDMHALHPGVHGHMPFLCR